MTMFILDLDQVQDLRAQPIVIAFRLRHRVAYRTSRCVLAFDPLLRGLGRGGTCGGLGLTVPQTLRVAADDVIQ